LTGGARARRLLIARRLAPADFDTRGKKIGIQSFSAQNRIAIPGCRPPHAAMQFLLLVYTDAELMDKLPAEEFNAEMRHCLLHADEQQAQGKLLAFQQLQPAAAARTVRVRHGRAAVLDGPFAETKEMLAGFNLVEADSMEDALRMAQELPWTKYGAIEVRPLGDVAAMRRRVGA
jgi:hypothetical protein